MSYRPPDSSRAIRHAQQKMTANREQFGAHIVSPDEIELISKLGEGAFGVVWKSKVRGTTCAVKVPKRQFLSEAQHKEFLKEVDIMSKINHVNVCLFMGASVEPGNIRIVTECMSGDLHDVIMNTSKHPNLPLSTRLKYARDAARGVAWLHGNQPAVLHRDLKLANMLIDDNHIVKVCDFGLSQLQEDETSRDIRPKGSPLYMAPEVLDKKDITKKVDVYAFGLVLWEMVVRERAFKDHKNYQIFKTAILRGDRPDIPANASPKVVALMQRCWDASPAARPDMTEVVEELDVIIEEMLAVERQEYVASKVPDAAAAALWQAKFDPKNSVSWEEFREGICAHWDIPVPRDPTSDPLPFDVEENVIQNASDEQLRDFLELENADDLSKDLVKEEMQKRLDDANQSDSGYVTREARFDLHSLSPIEHGMMCLKKLVSKDGADVTLSVFGQVSACFGPCDVEMLSRVGKMVSQRSFYGTMKSSDCEGLLKKADPNTYLIRFSGRKAGAFCISYRVPSSGGGGTVKHIVVVFDIASQTFNIGNDDNKYESFKDIITSRDFLKAAYKWPCDAFSALVGYY